MTVPIYFVTNRDPKPKAKPTDFGKVFSAAGVDDLRFGVAEMERGKGGKWALKGIRTAPEKLDGSDDAKSQLGSAEVFATLRDRLMKSKKDVLVYLHGYATSFRDALVNAARLQENHAAHIGDTAVFSWPSDGRTIPWQSYKSDRTDARASGPAFARAFIKAAEFMRGVVRAGGPRCQARIHLVAHSMGNYVLRNALQEVQRFVASTPRLFDHVFMMAADEDYDCFELEHKLTVLPRAAADVHVYFNRGDAALRISDGTKGNPNRLGTDGPRHPLNVPANVVNIDASEIVGGITEHSYYLDTPRVVEDMNGVFAGTAADQFPWRRYLASHNKYVLLAK
jgi:esterase/lipase superfamily enzyme